MLKKILTGKIRQFRKPHSCEHHISQLIFLNHLDGWNLEHQVKADEMTKGHSEIRRKDPKIWV